uniref:Uncharacterized protein n=1 Tax=Opuntia streptacantha TaxID=393608 RepID=A0A7C9E597_OPUST
MLCWILGANFGGGWRKSEIPGNRFIFFKIKWTSDEGHQNRCPDICGCGEGGEGKQVDTDMGFTEAEIKREEDLPNSCPSACPIHSYDNGWEISGESSRRKGTYGISRTGKT